MEKYEQNTDRCCAIGLRQNVALRVHGATAEDFAPDQTFVMSLLAIQ